MQMKISKIKNSRPGISVAENKNEESLSRQSLLYYAPVKDGKIRLESKDLEQHVTECNEKAQKLYNVITPEINFYRDENRQKMVENLARNFNAVINNALKYSLQGTTQGRYLTGGVPPVRFSM